MANSSEYFEIYKKRINRFGTDFQSRLLGQRERDFENYLLKSVYRVDFEFNGEMIPGTFERMKQDRSQTTQYLLVRNNVEIPNGTILMLPDNPQNEKHPWMVFYPDEIRTSGYNRYTMLKMTHYIKWEGRDKHVYYSWVYLYGKGLDVMKDTVQSSYSHSKSRFTEDENISTIIGPRQPTLQKDVYIEVGEGDDLQHYRVTGFDILSTPGVQYSSIDPIYEFDRSVATYEEGDDKSEFYWLSGGKIDGGS